MKITTEVSDVFEPTLSKRATLDEPVELICARVLTTQLEQWQAIDAADMRAALAANERLMALGATVAAHPDKLDAVEKDQCRFQPAIGEPGRGCIEQERKRGHGRSAA